MIGNIGCRWQSKDEEDLQAHCRALKKGGVYDWKDFCRIRAPTWYQAQVDRIVRACVAVGLKIELYRDYTKADWDKGQVWWHVENALKLGSDGHIAVTYGSRRDIKSASISSPPQRASKPSFTSSRSRRVQPSRTSKRKADNMEGSDETIPPIKKIKPESEPAEPEAVESKPQDPHSDYHLTEEEFRKSLKDFHVHTSSLSLPPSELADRKMIHATEWFRSRIMAEVVAKVNTRWNAKTKPKRHRCQLSEQRTEHPYVDPEVQIRCGKFTAINSINVNQPSVADMLSSPSLGNWPLDREEEDKDLHLPEEKMLKTNVVEIAGLRFLVDLCESNRWVVHEETESMVSPRIWML